MAELLEVAQLVDQHGVAEVQVRRGGVEAELDAQLAPAGAASSQLRLDDQLVGTPDEWSRMACSVSRYIRRFSLPRRSLLACAGF